MASSTVFYIMNYEYLTIDIYISVNNGQIEVPKAKFLVTKVCRFGRDDSLSGNMYI